MRSSIGEVAGDQRRLAGIAAEQFDHGNALVLPAGVRSASMNRRERVTAVEKPMQ